MIVAVDHAQIMIPSGGEPAARRFWCELVGLVEIEKPAELKARGGFWLQAGAQQIHVGVEEAAIGERAVRARKASAGRAEDASASIGRTKSRAHVGIEVTDLAAHRARLEAGGVAVTDGTQPSGFRRIEIRDPFGNRVELLERTIDAVGDTGRWMAAMRARESERPDALFHDPWARAVAGEEGFRLLEEMERERGENPFTAVRTRWFDDRVAEALGGGIRQVVLVAAGMDARAWRLAWPDGARLFEIDRPPVLAHKRAVITEAPRVPRVDVPADLEGPWESPLVRAGFDACARTLWIAEGLLFYLPEGATHALLDSIARLSPDGSVLLVDAPSVRTLSAPWMQGFHAKLAALGAPWRFATDEPEQLLAAHGFRAEASEPGGPGARFGTRWPHPVLPRERRDVVRTWFLSAVRARGSGSGAGT